MKTIGIFAEALRLARLSEMGDPLEKVLNAVDWEMFRSILDAVFHKEARGVGGRKATAANIGALPRYLTVIRGTKFMLQ